MAKLKRELIDALDNQTISLHVGYELSRLTQDEQELFMPYLPYLSCRLRLPIYGATIPVNVYSLWLSSKYE